MKRRWCLEMKASGVGIGELASLLDLLMEIVIDFYLFLSLLGGGAVDYSEEWEWRNVWIERMSRVGFK